MGRESADLPAQEQLFSDYSPLLREVEVFLHQSGLVADDPTADPGAEVKIPSGRGESVFPMPRTRC